MPFSVKARETASLYMSPAGNDVNPGARERPLASLEGARERIRALRESKKLSDTVFVRDVSRCLAGI
jgi:hypothetical protein